MKNRLKPQKILRQGRRGLNEGKEDAAEAQTMIAAAAKASVDSVLNETPAK